MSKKSNLLSAISAAALAMGTTQAALGSLKPDDSESPGSSQKAISASRDSDLFIELILATDGKFTPETVCAALPGLLTNLTHENARDLPDLMSNIRKLGVDGKVRQMAMETLLAWIAGAPVLADHPTDRLLIAAEVGRRAKGAYEPYRVAQAQGEGDHQREILDPNYSWDLDCVSFQPPLLPTTAEKY